MYIFLLVGFLICGATADQGQQPDQSKYMAALKTNLGKDVKARLTQTHIMSSKEEKGYFYWNSRKKCVRIEMDDGTVYLYNKGGLHIKEVDKGWSYVPLPSEWFNIFLNPDDVLKERNVSVQKINDTTYGVQLLENGKFAQVFWTNDGLKGWVQGSVSGEQLMNEVCVDLELQKPVKLADYLWEPETSFNVGR